MSQPLTKAIYAVFALGSLASNAHAEPTFSCDDGTKIESGLYERTRETATRHYLSQAQLVAEAFWRVAETFKGCQQIKILGESMTKAGYPASTKWEIPAGGGSIGIAYLYGKAGATSWSGLPVGLLEKGGTAVVNGKTVPDALSVDGVKFVPFTSGGKWTLTSESMAELRKSHPDVNVEKVLDDAAKIAIRKEGQS